MLKVGGEVDAFCVRCELVLAHTIHALLGGRPVKVECNTCHAIHRYRSPPGRRAPSAGTARAHGDRAERDFEALLAERGAATARPYSPRTRLALGDLVDHPVFGRGLVTTLRDGDKAEITFRAGAKVLVHGRS